MPTLLDHGGVGSRNSSLSGKQASVCSLTLALVSTATEDEKLLILTLGERRGGLATRCAVTTETFLAERERHAAASLSSD